MEEVVLVRRLAVSLLWELSVVLFESDDRDDNDEFLSPYTSLPNRWKVMIRAYS